MAKFDELKNLYEDGYRCIYYDGEENNRTIYLKNFYRENSQAVELNLDNEQDFSDFKDYIGSLRMS